MVASSTTIFLGECCPPISTRHDIAIESLTAAVHDMWLVTEKTEFCNWARTSMSRKTGVKAEDDLCNLVSTCVTCIQCTYCYYRLAVAEVEEETGKMRIYPATNIIRMEPRDTELPYMRPISQDEAVEVERKRQYMSR